MIVAPSNSGTVSTAYRCTPVLGILRRLLSSTVFGLTLALLAGVVPSGAATFHSTLGSVTATLTYTGKSTDPKGTTITVTKKGRVIYRAAVRASMCGRLCWPEPMSGSFSGNPVRVVHLEAGAPDVVIGLYSGGAHCCFVDLVLWPKSPSRLGAVSIVLGDPGALVKALPGSPYSAFVTADDSFAYKFTDFAASGLPIKILRFKAGRFVNVTGQYSSMIRADATRWLTAYRQTASSHYDDSVGLVAAWVADEYLLGRASEANHYLHLQVAAGHLHSLLNPSISGAQFVTQLHKFLQREGY
ncbi:MAG: hypothetical protein ABI298_01800 [Acidimicrobiales bacterium]